MLIRLVAITMRAAEFLSPQRDQPMLLPVDMREWQPDDDLVFVVLDAVSTIDLGVFLGSYRSDRLGLAAYDPEMMIARPDQGARR